MTIRLPLLLVAAAALPLVAGCDRAETCSAVELAARVNGNRISVMQVADAIDRNPGLATSGRPTAAEALERLIDQELLVETALAEKLDREPQVMQAIAAAKRRILGLAYLERKVPPLPARSREEVRKFYVDHPVLFEQRRIYRLRELSAVVPPEHRDVLRNEIAGARQLDDIANRFKSRGLAFDDIGAVRPAEQIPLEFLPRLAAMKHAQVALFESTGKLTAVELVGSEEAPLTEAQAAPLIDQLLTNRSRLALAIKEVERLRAAADIEYLGRFIVVGSGAAPPRHFAAPIPNFRPGSS